MIGSEDIKFERELEELIALFDKLEGKNQLLFLKTVLEKLENNEIAINEAVIDGMDIGIDDAFACCRKILKIVDSYSNIE